MSSTSEALVQLAEQKEALRVIANRYLDNEDRLAVDCTLQDIIDVLDEYDEYSYMNAFLNSIEVFPDKNYSINDAEGHIKGLRDYSIYNNTAIKSLLLKAITIVSDNSITGLSNCTEIIIPNLVTARGNALNAGCIKYFFPKLSTSGRDSLQCSRATHLILPKYVSNYGYSALSGTLYEYADTYSYLFTGKEGYNNATNYKTLVLRKKAIVTLSSVANLDFIIQNNGFVAVPYSQLTSYQAATNWVSHPDVLVAIEKSLIDLQNEGGYIEDFYEIVDELPTTNIKTDITYFVPTATENVYEQWFYGSGSWEQLSNITLDTALIAEWRRLGGLDL